jgi:hypothetical protein
MFSGVLKYLDVFHYGEKLQSIKDKSCRLSPSNVKNVRTNVPISFWNETKTSWYRSRFSLIENTLFRFCPESALLYQIERIFFDGGTNLVTNSIVFLFHSY